MAISTYFDRISRIDQLIRLQATGTPQDLARKLGICKSNLYLYLEFMRSMGAPIIYNQYRNSFVYEQKGSFKIGFNVKPLDTNELKILEGGSFVDLKFQVINNFSFSNPKILD